MAKQKLIFFGWIEASIRYGGVFGQAEKVAYRETFGVSEGTVSRHQAEFEILFEEACGKVFARNAEGRVHGGRLALSEDAKLPEEPVFPKMPGLERWLQDSLGGTGYFEEEIRRRDPEPWVMRSVIRSIRSKLPLRITYHSRSGEGERTISPHAIVRVAGRFHARAFDHFRNEYRDFVLSRIIDVTPVQDRLEYVGPETDMSWSQRKTLVIEEKEGVSGENARSGVRLDFGLNGTGRHEIIVREALVHYLIDDMKEGYTSPVRVFEKKPSDPDPA